MVNKQLLALGLACLALSLGDADGDGKCTAGSDLGYQSMSATTEECAEQCAALDAPLPTN
jgi:hypothetical protein